MITVENVSKRYQGREVLSDISFTAAPGAVTGFLGPNGAGKTTTMRILLGLTRATSGRALIDGQRMGDLPNAGRTVGVLLDARALSPSRTGRENLVLAGMTMGLGPIDTRTALERVGLTRDAGEKRVGAYSLGMRQRLGIAQALLGDPHVIILDEPVNGLDPSGILWMRRLLRELADEGRTVLLSSHLIHEVERIADHIVLINRGAIVTAGQVDEIIGESGARVVTPHATQLVAALERRGIDVIARDGDVVVAATEPEVAATIAFSEQILLHEVSARSSRSLEDRFFELTAVEETA